MNDPNIPSISCKRGIRKEYRTLESEVWKWVVAESNKLGKLPTKVTIQKYAQQKYRDAGYPDFKASIGWYRRWGKRYKLKESCSTVQANNDIQITASYSDETKMLENNLVCQPNDSTSLSKTLESFSIETDKLMSNIEMINSPSEFFDFTDSAIDMNDMMKNSESNDILMRNFMKELIDDFGRYFNDSHSDDEVNDKAGKLIKKSCKYDKDFKDKVIGFITKHRVMEAATKFKIHPSTISVWMKENKFQNQLTQIIIEEATMTNNISEIRNKEREFCNWLHEKEKNNKIVSKEEVKEVLSNLFVHEWPIKSHWFAKYCHKYLYGKQLSKSIKINYSNQFQKLMVRYANRTSQIRTAAVFNLARKQLFNWTKNTQDDADGKKQTEEKLYQWYDSKSLKPAGRTVREKAEQLFNDSDLKCSYSWYYKWCAKNNVTVKRNCDEKLVEWILTVYDENINVSHEDVQKKALEIYNSQNEGNFKASTGWLLRFCRRYMNLLRRIPPLSANLPPTCKLHIQEVQKQVIEILNKYKMDGSCYGVMDEILLKLKPGMGNKEIPKKPLLRSCGTSNIQGMVILTCLSNGTILPPVLVLKDKHDVRNDPNHFPIVYQPNGIVDNSVMHFWLTNVWFRYIKQPNLLMMDCFAPHDTELVKNTFQERKSHVIIIPAGCSSKLNPLTQVISPQFQETIDKHCSRWFEENSLTWQMDGNSRSLYNQDIIDWVGKAYKNINTEQMQENVRNVFEQMELSPIK